MSNTTLDTTTVRRWKRYPEYKRAGSTWLGEVPEHWRVSRVKWYCDRLQSGSTPPTADHRYYESEEIPWYAPGSFGSELLLTEPVKLIAAIAVREGVARLFPAGSTMLVTIGATIGKVGYIHDNASCNQQITAVSFVKQFVYPKYAAFQLKRLEPVLQGIAPSTTLPILDQQEVGTLPFMVPPLPEQRTIAAFLDRETARIDSLIGQKERLIALLEEKRQAVISHTVTRGLNPAAPLKDSGVPWLGMVPKHWEVKRLKYSVQFLNYRRIPLSSEERGGLEKIYPYYGASGIIDQVDRYLFDEPLILIGEDGANLLSRSTPLAFIATGKYWVNNHAHILKPKSRQLVYWTERLNSISYEPFVTGSAQPKLTIDALGSIEFATPDTPEQAKIAKYIEEQDARLSPVMSRVRDGIAHLQEYRTALISAAVTGQIDVRGDVPGEPATSVAGCDPTQSDPATSVVGCDPTQCMIPGRVIPGD